MKILVIDDTKTERLIMTSYLEKLGHSVVTGNDGHEALELFKSESVDLIIMDVIMPIMDGYQAAQAIRKLDIEWVPIIFLSARVDPENISEGIDAGGDDYLTKPVNLVVLDAKMRAMERISKMRHKLLKTSDELKKTNIELQKLVNVDGLTGIANRRYLDRFLHAELSRSIRYKKNISVILIDIDYFKPYNDAYGHLQGDDCLKQVAQSLANQCKRSTDLVARYGGEEFAVILPDTPLEDAKQIAEKLRQGIESLKIEHQQSTVSDVLTLSLGLCSILPAQGDKFENMLLCADKALYKSKEAGRNCVSTAD